MPEINFRWSLFLIVNNKQSVDVFVFFISCGNEEKGVVCDKKRFPLHSSSQTFCWKHE